MLRYFKKYGIKRILSDNRDNPDLILKCLKEMTENLENHEWVFKSYMTYCLKNKQNKWFDLYLESLSEDLFGLKLTRHNIKHILVFNDFGLVTNMMADINKHAKVDVNKLIFSVTRFKVKNN